MTKKKPFIILLLIVFVSIVIYVVFNNYGQETTIISLNNDVKNKAQENKIILRLDSADNILEENNDKAQELAKLSLFESQKLENKFLQMRSYYILGKSVVEMDSINTSQKYYNSALLLAKEIEDNWYIGDILYREAKNQYKLNNTKLALETFNEALYYCQLTNNYKTIGATYSMIGTIFRVNGAYSRAIEYFIKSKLNYNKANFSEGDAWGAYLLGQIYRDLRNNEKAMQYFQESLDKYQVLYSSDGKTNGLAICYEQIALLYLELKNFDEASKYTNKLLEIRRSSKSTYGISNANSLLGKLEYLAGNYEKAQSFLDKSLDIKNGYLSLHSKPSVYMYKGLCTIKLGDLDGGVKEIEQGLEIALTNNFKKNQLEIYSKLAEIYLNINNFKKGIYYKNKQIELQNLILFGDTDVQIKQLQTFYELDEKNRLINELKKENVVNVLKIKQQSLYQIIMISVILIVILIAIIIAVFYSKLHHKNNELKVLNTTTNKLFSIIAHDLRSPFNTILGFSDLLSSKAKDLETSNIIKFSKNINAAATNTLELLDNLLNWAKSQTGQITFKPSIFNLKPIMAQTIDVLHPTAELKKITLSYIQPDSIEVYADLHMLKTILLNLITNAIKFTHSKGMITVNALQKNNDIEMTVSDDGIGMDKDTLSKLFTLQTNETIAGTANEKGSGLGLVLCKELIEKHGGTIWVVSEPNKGATFHFTLPNKI